MMRQRIILCRRVDNVVVSGHVRWSSVDCNRIFSTDPHRINTHGAQMPTATSDKGAALAGVD
jgi:hypothetical protein